MNARPIALLAEDDLTLRMLAADMLGELAFDVLQAGDAAEAMRELEAQPATVLLMTDVQMPGTMDGFALARAAAVRWPSIVILVCSGRLGPKPGDLPPEARFINKPFTVETVMLTLQQLNVA